MTYVTYWYIAILSLDTTTSVWFVFTVGISLKSIVNKGASSVKSVNLPLRYVLYPEHFKI